MKYKENGKFNAGDKEILAWKIEKEVGAGGCHGKK